jgi:hypothetical protein
MMATLHDRPNDSFTRKAVKGLKQYVKDLEAKLKVIDDKIEVLENNFDHRES